MAVTIDWFEQNYNYCLRQPMYTNIHLQYMRPDSFNIFSEDFEGIL